MTTLLHLLLARLVAVLIWITDGRPMTITGYAFRDVVSRKSVYYATDLKGRTWLTEGRWSLDRAETTTHG